MKLRERVAARELRSLRKAREKRAALAHEEAVIEARVRLALLPDPPLAIRGLYWSRAAGVCVCPS